MKKPMHPVRAVGDLEGQTRAPSGSTRVKVSTSTLRMKWVVEASFVQDLGIAGGTSVCKMLGE